MPWIDKHGRLPSLLIVAALACAQDARAQAPAQGPASPPRERAQNLAQPAPQPPQTQLPTIIFPPQPPPTPEELGDALMAQQRYQAAIEAYKKGPRKSATLQNKLGIAYQMLLDTSDALRCYEEALKLDRKNANALNNLGTIYDAQKEYKAAEKMYRKALKFDPKSAPIHKNLGTVLIEEHKYNKGLRAYQDALAIDPQVFEKSAAPKFDSPATAKDRGAMNYYLAKSYLSAGMKGRAVDYLRLAINEGFITPKKVMEEGEFAALKGMPAFDQMMAAQGSL